MFVGYLTAGQRGLAFTKDAAIALVKGGVDVLEMGVPYSDPIADGPVIQKAMQDALSRQVNLEKILTTIKAIKAVVDVNIVLFSYYNPLLKAIKNNGLQEIKAAGVDSMLVVDLPREESDDFYQACDASNLKRVTLIAPSTPIARIELLRSSKTDFYYYVCRNGTTGVKKTLPKNFSEKINMIKNILDQPVVAGFGISNKEMSAEVMQYADGFVVGSRFVDAIANGASATELTALAQSIDPRGK